MAILGRVTNRAAAALRATALAGTILLASGCAAFSPVQTDYDYDAADGVPLTIEGLDLRDLAVVVPAKGGTGIVVGQAINRTTSAVDVTFAVKPGHPPRRPSPCRPTRARRSRMPRPASRSPASRSRPARWCEMTVTTDEAGANIVKVPVLRQPGLLRGPHRLVLLTPGGSRVENMPSAPLRRRRVVHSRRGRAGAQTSNL